MKKPLLVSSSLLGGLIVCLAAAPALAQDSTSPPPASAPATSPMAASNTGGGAIGVGAVAWLGSSPNALGITTTRTPVAGGEFVYDMPVFHLEAVLGFDHASAMGATATDFRFGVAGWYHLAKGTNADFSIGGGAGLVYASLPGAGNSATAFTLEPGAEARVFLSPNFSLSCRLGFAITFGDNSSPTVLSLAGDTTGALGFTYFFR